MNLTCDEIVSLRIAIAEEMGWTEIPLPPNASWGQSANGKEWHFAHQLPPYTTSIDAIQAACLERFGNDFNSNYAFELSLGESDLRDDQRVWQLTALEWCIAFARTAKIWRFK